jgi:Ca2+-binding EF-hand superfamily protein
LAGEWVNFETFLSLITEKVGNPFSEQGRRAMFNLVDPKKKEVLDMEDLKRIAEQLKFSMTDD